LKRLKDFFATDEHGQTRIFTEEFFLMGSSDDNIISKNTVPDAAINIASIPGPTIASQALA